MQIYLEQLYDLLSPESGPLQLREDPAGGAFVQGASSPLLSSEEEALRLLEQAKSLSSLRSPLGSTFPSFTPRSSPFSTL